jgi:hypothetical protein
MDWVIEVRTLAEAKGFFSSLCAQTGYQAHPASCPMDTGGPFPVVKCGSGVTLTTHPHLAPRSWMSRSYTSFPPCASMVCCGTALCYFYLYVITLFGGFLHVVTITMMSHVLFCYVTWNCLWHLCWWSGRHFCSWIWKLYFYSCSTNYRVRLRQFC